MSFYRIDEILKLVIGWEQRLNSFYEMMEEYLKDKRSRQIVLLLQQQQVKTLEVLKGINVKEYDHTEYVKNIPDYHSEEIMPHFEISADSSPVEVFETILSYEEKLEKFYTHIRDVLTFTKSKELLDMLIQFKMGQIKQIKAYMDSCDLVM